MQKRIFLFEKLKMQEDGEKKMDYNKWMDHFYNKQRYSAMTSCFGSRTRLQKSDIEKRERELTYEFKMLSRQELEQKAREIDPEDALCYAEDLVTPRDFHTIQILKDDKCDSAICKFKTKAIPIIADQGYCDDCIGLGILSKVKMFFRHALLCLPFEIYLKTTYSVNRMSRSVTALMMSLQNQLNTLNENCNN